MIRMKRKIIKNAEREENNEIRKRKYSKK